MTFDTNTMRCIAAIAITCVATILLLLALRLPRREYFNVAQPFLWRRTVRAARALSRIIEPLSMYNPSDDVSYSTLDKISVALSGWYVDHGNFLNDPARQAYTVLQDAIQIVLSRAERSAPSSEGVEPWQAGGLWVQAILRHRDLRAHSRQIQQLEIEQGLNNHFHLRRIWSILNGAESTHATPPTSKLELHPDYVLIRYLVVKLRAALVVGIQRRSGLAAPLELCE